MQVTRGDYRRFFLFLQGSFVIAAPRMQATLRRASCAPLMAVQARRLSSKALCSPRAEEYAKKVNDFMQQVPLLPINLNNR